MSMNDAKAAPVAISGTTRPSTRHIVLTGAVTATARQCPSTLEAFPDAGGDLQMV